MHTTPAAWILVFGRRFALVSVKEFMDNGKVLVDLGWADSIVAREDITIEP